tara:strand:+ start:2549 stop:3322 length:774 start_codon:yes stop_codon:yes gene_type:complete
MKNLIIIQHLEREGPGLFYEIGKERGFSIKIYNLYKDHYLPKPKKGDLVLIMGGPMGVSDINNEKYPWLKDEINFIKQLLENEISYIGICLGAQLLAYGAGGNVEKLRDKSNNKIRAEIGWSEISSNYNKSNDISCFLRDPLYVLHWHEDRILLPNNAELIAGSTYCKEQLFKIGSYCYGLQFHIENNISMTKRWIKEDKKFIIKHLGLNGPKIIEKQSKNHEINSLKRRISLINKLFDDLDHKKTLHICEGNKKTI